MTAAILEWPDVQGGHKYALVLFIGLFTILLVGSWAESKLLSPWDEDDDVEFRPYDWERDG